MRLHRDVQERRLPLAGGRVAARGGKPCPALPHGRVACPVTHAPPTSTSTEVVERYSHAL